MSVTSPSSGTVWSVMPRDQPLELLDDLVSLRTMKHRASMRIANAIGDDEPGDLAAGEH